MDRLVERAVIAINRKIDERMAREIAKAYLSENPIKNCLGIGKVFHCDEFPFRRLRLFLRRIEGCWVCYAERPEDFDWICSSDIIAVSSETGEVVYAGSARDEG